VAEEIPGIGPKDKSRDIPRDRPKEEPRELRVKSIINGTVIDHIAGGQALNVLKILGISGTTDATVSVVMNVESGKLGKKDIVKVEDRELLEEELNRIALIAPNASINIIRDYKVIEKRPVDLPDEIVGVVRCQPILSPGCWSRPRTLSRSDASSASSL